MPQDLNELELAKYIYIQLGLIKSFDTKYYFGTHDQQVKMYKIAQRTSENMEEAIQKRKIICVSISEMYRYLLQHYGIQSEVSKEVTILGHAYNIIYFKDGRIMEADLQKDLEKIQLGMKTKYFGVDYGVSYATISEKENIRIDKKIGRIKEESDYRDEKIEKMIRNLRGLDILEQVEQILKADDIVAMPKDIGYVERAKFYYNLIGKILNPYLSVKCDIFHCYRYKKVKDLDEEEKKYIMLLSIYPPGNNLEVYAFSDSKGKFVKVTNKSALLKIQKSEDKEKSEGKIFCSPWNKSILKKVQRHIKKEIKKGSREEEKC